MQCNALPAVRFDLRYVCRPDLPPFPTTPRLLEIRSRHAPAYALPFTLHIHKLCVSAYIGLSNSSIDHSSHLVWLAFDTGRKNIMNRIVQQVTSRQFKLSKWGEGGLQSVHFFLSIHVARWPPPPESCSAATSF
ncbi:uncharacterized protein EI90DRAFT_1991909 [Cantharellus anzutake]|uniref:uncharacterized protein n=1 Tax=Cantharellus anzutake TaxID=1750568 RepID=UPI00190675A2|nr:uncharacterized protein EI90DRAFT_1991909 [Cantharellus anzutake]KAF8326060.1 hypothetical protein EI90DRAFT_1991909 [Cantharellus anzutake]